MSPRENQTPPDMRDPSPQPSAATADLRSLTSSTLLTWKKLHRLLQGDDCIIDGSSLDIASVVAVAKLVSCRCSFPTKPA
jgi:phenylalanine ammonia-lyase